MYWNIALYNQKMRTVKILHIKTVNKWKPKHSRCAFECMKELSNTCIESMNEEGKKERQHEWTLFGLGKWICIPVGMWQLRSKKKSSDISQRPRIKDSCHNIYPKTHPIFRKTWEQNYCTILGTCGLCGCGLVQMLCLIIPSPIARPPPTKPPKVPEAPKPATNSPTMESDPVDHR